MVSILFVVCLIVFLFILIPPVLLLIFTKHFYRNYFVVKYLKPYLDALQAPFKDNCHYYPGMELIIRGISFVVGNRVFDDRKTQANITLLCVLLLMYLCTFRPFKSTSNMVLYINFIMNIQCVIVLIIYSNGKHILSYTIILCILILVAIVEFGGIILYCVYINYLYKIKPLQYLMMKVNHVTNKFKRRLKRTATQHDCASLGNQYEQYQEELLGNGSSTLTNIHTYIAATAIAMCIIMYNYVTTYTYSSYYFSLHYIAIYSFPSIQY